MGHDQVYDGTISFIDCTGIKLHLIKSNQNHTVSSQQGFILTCCQSLSSGICLCTGHTWAAVNRTTVTPWWEGCSGAWIDTRVFFSAIGDYECGRIKKIWIWGIFTGQRYCGKTPSCQPRYKICQEHQIGTTEARIMQRPQHLGL